MGVKSCRLTFLALTQAKAASFPLPYRDGEVQALLSSSFSALGVSGGGTPSSPLQALQS